MIIPLGIDVRVIVLNHAQVSSHYVSILFWFSLCSSFARKRFAVLNALYHFHNMSLLGTAIPFLIKTKPLMRL